MSPPHSSRTLCRDSESTSDEPIAIVGMGLRLPGQVHTTAEFWEMLVNRRDGHGHVPPSRYNADAFFDPSSAPTSGYFLQEDPAYFDAPFFSIGAKEASEMDPQQRLLLEVVWECLENAGETGWRGKKVGCYVGTFGEDWLEMKLKGLEPRTTRFHAMGTGGFALANRISYEFDFCGPSMTIQTACSASLISLHEACQGLRSGQCSAAIVAGSNLMWTPTMTGAMHQNTVLSLSGKSKTFDATADGYGRGEAINAVYIKRLSDALRDQDKIRAIIRATAANSDGKIAAISNPNPAAQESLIRSAYRRAQIDDIGQTGLFECHGTGTTVGDSIEATVVGKVFDGAGVVIGGVKPNCGHAEGASGLNSLIKAVLALENRVIPPNANFNTSNPRLPFNETKLHVPTKPMAWPEDRQERVSVNSFGIGGSNAHVILDSSRSFGLDYESHAASAGPQLLVLSAYDGASLQMKISQLTGYIQKQRSSFLHDIAYTLGVRREHLGERAFAVVHPNTPVQPSDFQTVQSSTGRAPPTVTFVFTGQGAQWAGMGKSLLNTEPRFRAAIEAMDEVLQSLEDPPKWSLKDELARDDGLSRVNEVELAQPLCTALQLGLVQVFVHWGIQPEAVVGHSSGEIAAAYAAGAITLKSAIIVAYYRGKLAQLQEGFGAMAAVGLSREAVMPFIVETEGVIVACENSPQNVTLSGDKEKMEQVLEKITASLPGTFCRRLRVRIAYHSAHMEPIGARYESAIAHHINHGRSMRPLASTVTGNIVTNPSELGAAYWRRNLESPVLFSGAVERIIRSDSPSHHVFVEIGPHSALSAPLRQIFQKISPQFPPEYIPTLARNDEDAKSLLLATAGHVFVTGSPINLSRTISHGRLLTDLPRYPWKHDQRYWSEGRACRDWRLRSLPHHELLGSRVMESTSFEPAWRNMLHLNDVPWLSDHVLQGDVIFPGAGYIAMAGEAVQQMVPDSNCYSVQNIHFLSPLLLTSEAATEIITSLKPIELADGIDSGWYHFSVSAYDSLSWTECCKGIVRAGTDHAIESKQTQIHPFARQVESNRWYRSVERAGLQYGPHFQGLRNITADPIHPVAVGSVCDPEEQYGSRYTLHPTTIDQCLQLIGIAALKGMLHKLSGAFVPSRIESLVVSKGPSSHAIFEVQSQPVSLKEQCANAIGTSEGQTILSLKGAVLTGPGEPRASDVGDDHLAARVSWQPDIDLLSPSKFLKSDHIDNFNVTRMSGLLSLLYVRATAVRIANLESQQAHLMKWKAWLMRESDEIHTGVHPSIIPLSHWVRDLNPDNDPHLCLLMETIEALASPQSDDLSTLPSPVDSLMTVDPLSALETIHEQMDQLPDDVCRPVFLQCMRTVFENCQSMMSGDSSPLDILMEKNLLGRFHEDFDMPNGGWGPLLQLLGHANPALRILEVGAGTGATTRTALSYLKSTAGTRLYSQYVFTDISAGFFLAARESLHREENMEYRTLDISRDPSEQGFEPRSFDIVIATNVFHATPSLRETLQHVHSLLARDGRLLLHEPSIETHFVPYIMGSLPGWWVGADDKRIDSPCVSPDRWDQELRAVGFTDIEIMESERERKLAESFSLICRPSPPPTIRNQVTLLVRKLGIEGWISEVEESFRQKGYTVHYTTLDDPPPCGQIVVSLLDFESPYFRDLSEKSFTALQQFLLQSSECRFIWVTHSITLSCEDPLFGIVYGFSRTLRWEASMDISVLEMDGFDTTTANTLVTVHERIQHARELANPRQEYEFALDKGVIYTSRTIPTSLTQQLAYAPPVQVPRRLAMGRIGHLETFHWSPVAQESELKPGEAEVDIRFVGLNFRDVLTSVGMIGHPDSLGLEMAGIVRRVAPDVTDLTLGSRVVAVGQGLFCTRKTLPREGLVKLPDAISLKDAASMPTVYCTAIYSLIQIANVQKGQSVLIHSAAGGVGLAAISVCQMLGAEIYATVGNEEKASYLINTYGISRDRIFHSRDTSFLPAIMRATDGQGVDVVLNSLSGKLLHASWECVAHFGKFIELGKRDILSHGTIKMEPFLGNRMFCGVDVSQLARDRPKLMNRTMKQYLELLNTGKIRPLQPLHIFGASQIAEAFRYLQTGNHIGKVVVEMPPDASTLPCLGGIGRSVSRWLVERGARHLIYLSPSAGSSDKHQAFEGELKAQGCLVSFVKGSVTDLADVQRAVAECPRLAGVVQMAMNLQDRTFQQMTQEEWSTALAPKVTGSWNLHCALEGQALDFFVMFGSVAGSTGSVGQTNYSAANTYISALGRYRRQRGLVASVLNLGAVEDIGFLSRQSDGYASISMANVESLREGDVLNAFHAAVLDSRPESEYLGSLEVFGPMKAGMEKATPLGHDARFALQANLAQSTAQAKAEGPSEQFREILNRIHQQPLLLKDVDAVDTLRQNMGRLMAMTVGISQDLDADKAAAISIDSLMAIEVRSWARRVIKLEISLPDITKAGTVGGLIDFVIAQLCVRYSIDIGEGEKNT